MRGQRSWVLIPLLGAVLGCSPAAPPDAPAAAIGAPGQSTSSSAERMGEMLFAGNCIPCHQQNGRGIPGVYPSLAGSPTVLGDPKPLALWILKGQRAPTMALAGSATAMPQFGWLTESDAAALFTYLRSSFGNQAPPVAAAEVAKAIEP